MTEKSPAPCGAFLLLSHQDSNLGKQNQNLMCYHYTMGHPHLQNEGAKILTFRRTGKFIFFNTHNQRHHSGHPANKKQSHLAFKHGFKE